MAYSEILTYCGGIPGADKTGDLLVIPQLDHIEIRLGAFKGKYRVLYDNIINISIKTDEQISKDVTLTRLLLTGIFAFGLKKKTKHITNYLVIEYTDSGISSSMIFTGDKIPKFHSRLLKQQQEYYKKHPEKIKTDTTEPAADSYAEIEKLHGLLEKKIITQSEFDEKKKQLLGL